MDQEKNSLRVAVPGETIDMDFDRYESGLINSFEDHATPDTGIVASVTPDGIEFVARHRQTQFDVRATWADVIDVFRGGLRG